MPATCLCAYLWVWTWKMKLPWFFILKKAVAALITKYIWSCLTLYGSSVGPFSLCLWPFMQVCVQLGQMVLFCTDGHRRAYYVWRKSATILHTHTHTDRLRVYFLQVQCLLAFEIIKGWPFWGEAEMSPMPLHWQEDSPHRVPWHGSSGFSLPRIGT